MYSVISIESAPSSHAPRLYLPSLVASSEHEKEEKNNVQRLKDIQSDTIIISRSLAQSHVGYQIGNFGLHSAARYYSPEPRKQIDLL